jgi:hypothetical protein
MKRLRTLVSVLLLLLSFKGQAIDFSQIPAQILAGTPGYTNAAFWHGNCDLMFAYVESFQIIQRPCSGPVIAYVNGPDDYAGGPFTIGNQIGGSFALWLPDLIVVREGHWWGEVATFTYPSWILSLSESGIFFVHPISYFFSGQYEDPVFGESWQYRLSIETRTSSGNVYYGSDFFVVMPTIRQLAEPPMWGLAIAGLLLIGWVTTRRRPIVPLQAKN